MKRNCIISTSLLVAGLMLPLSAISSGSGLPPEVESKSDQVAPQAVVTGGCGSITKIHFAASDDTGQSTTSTNYVNVPNMSTSFNIPGTAPSCVIVDFSATTFAPAGELIFVRARMNGLPGIPAEVQFSGDDDENADGAWARAHNHQFVFKGVSPGFKTVNVEWKSLFGGTVFAHWRTMTVHHK